MWIREGSLREVVQVVAKIDEFARAEDEQSLQARLGTQPRLVLVAEHNRELLGFKIGYALDDDIFYSWLGGVAPEARGQGIAQRLLDAQESWVRAEGFKRIKVKSRNQFPAMLRLLIKNGYLIDGYEKKQPELESRIHFDKEM